MGAPEPERVSVQPLDVRYAAFENLNMRQDTVPVCGATSIAHLDGLSSPHSALP